MTYNAQFPHQRLDAYRVAVDLAVQVEGIAGRLPRGYGDLRDQLRRAAGSIVRNIAEGANRHRPRDKAARFTIAQGECGEADASLELAERFGLVAAVEARSARELAGRVGAMLMGLIQLQQNELDERPAKKRPSAQLPHDNENENENENEATDRE